MAFINDTRFVSLVKAANIPEEFFDKYKHYLVHSSNDACFDLEDVFEDAGYNTLEDAQNSFKSLYIDKEECALLTIEQFKSLCIVSENGEGVTTHDYYDKMETAMLDYVRTGASCIDFKTIDRDEWITVSGSPDGVCIAPMTDVENGTYFETFDSNLHTRIVQALLCDYRSPGKNTYRCTESHVHTVVMIAGVVLHTLRSSTELASRDAIIQRIIDRLVIKKSTTVEAECDDDDESDIDEEEDPIEGFVAEYVKEDAGFFTLEDAQKKFKASDFYTMPVKNLKHELERVLGIMCCPVKVFDGKKHKDVFAGFTLV